jgi:hypothetical protein
MFNLSRIQGQKIARRVKNDLRAATRRTASLSRTIGSVDAENPEDNGSESNKLDLSGLFGSAPSSSGASAVDFLTSDARTFGIRPRHTEDGFDVFLGNFNGDWIMLNIYELSTLAYQRVSAVVDVLLTNKSLAAAGLAGTCGGLIILFGGKPLAVFSWKEFLGSGSNSDSFIMNTITRLYAAYAFAMPIIRLRDYQWQHTIQVAEITRQQNLVAHNRVSAELERNELYIDSMSLMPIEHPVAVYEGGVRQLFEVRSLRQHFLYQTNTLGRRFEDVINPNTGVPFERPFHSLEEIVEDSAARAEIEEHRQRLLLHQLQSLEQTTPLVPNQFMRRLENAMAHFLAAIKGGPLIALSSSVFGFVSVSEPKLTMTSDGQNQVTWQYAL